MLNIVKMLKEIETRCSKETKILFMGDVKDTKIYDVLHIKRTSHWGDSRFWVANVKYYKENLMEIYQEMDDSVGKYAEHFILKFARMHKNDKGFIFRFKHQVQFGGIDGIYSSSQIVNIRLQKDSSRHKIINLFHYIIRTLFPNIWI